MRRPFSPVTERQYRNSRPSRCWFIFLLLLFGVATIIVSFILTLLCRLTLLCGICVFPCHRLLSPLLSKDRRGIFNVRNGFSACSAHEDESGTDESAQVLTRTNWRNAFFNRTQPGVEPTVAAFTGSPAQRANQWATPPVFWLSGIPYSPCWRTIMHWMTI